jgi:polysaccharide deacetylase family protein (PEP-CTERM system associated)
VTTDARVRNAFTVDVEDWFQVSGFASTVDRASWDGRERRVEGSTRTILDLLASRGVHATFFVLGWVAERCPELLRALREGGHEIASHGYEHALVDRLTPDAFRADLRRASAAIESACGVRVEGFRAPSFSISAGAADWAFDVLRDEGYRFSSSVFPVRHDRYGIPGFSRRPVRLEDARGRAIWEFPMTTWRVLGRNLPVAGGGWLRVLPPAAMRHAFRKANAEGVPAILYTHPWEVDPEQPRLADAPRMARWRHTVNLDRTHARLAALLDRFRWGTVSEALDDYARSEAAGGVPGLRSAASLS